MSVTSDNNAGTGQARQAQLLANSLMYQIHQSSSHVVGAVTMAEIPTFA